MYKVMPYMALMKEVYFIFDVYIPNPEVFCKLFEDNQGCISVAEFNKFSPRTKHIAVKYQHFRSFVRKHIICMFCIDTQEQAPEIFTKPLDEALFIYLRRKESGW